MVERKSPRLRSAHKSSQVYQLNNLQKDFPFKLGREIVYLLATKRNPTLEGQEWEEIFSICIGAQWKPSNIGLDDIVLGNCAWGAKTIKSPHPFTQRKVRLISGRNSPIYSFGDTKILKSDPANMGEKIISIWNERVIDIKRKFKDVRTVVLIKSGDLTELVIFESETKQYVAEMFDWKWNKSHNLEGYRKSSSEHIFTWQPHGSQFTIIETVPTDCLKIQITPPSKLNKQKILDGLGFNKSWIKVVK